MATLTRWDPFGEMQRLTDQVFRAWGGEPATRGFAPAVDIYEDNGSIYVKAELPGVKAEDVHVDVEDHTLTLRGERKLEHEEKREGYHRIESSYGSFTRSFALPESCDTEKVEADMSEGVLTVKIPKKAEVMPKRIEVKSKGGSETAKTPVQPEKTPAQKK
jgi:HSP20 family protein